jgi:hypothetical protein
MVTHEGLLKRQGEVSHTSGALSAGAGQHSHGSAGGDCSWVTGVADLEGCAPPSGHRLLWRYTVSYRMVYKTSQVRTVPYDMLVCMFEWINGCLSACLCYCGHN